VTNATDFTRTNTLLDITNNEPQKMTNHPWHINHALPTNTETSVRYSLTCSIDGT